MCQYLSANDMGMVRWCQACEIYHLSCQNLMISFSVEAFDEFKATLTASYQYHSTQCVDRNSREILFNTHAQGMQLLFSVNEVGNLLKLMQDASLERFLL